MTKIVLPRLNQTGANEYADVQANDEAITTVVNGEIDTENLKAAAGITAGQLASTAKPLTWYTPSIIATEQSRTNVAFGTLETADEITGVVLPTNGLIVIGYQALVKQSVSEAARAAVFLGANQLKATNGVAQESLAFTGTVEFKTLGSSTAGVFVGGGSTQATTGQILAAESVGNFGGFTTVFAAAGTYAISVKFKSTSGSVTAKERKLWVWTLGF